MDILNIKIFQLKTVYQYQHLDHNCLKPHKKLPIKSKDTPLTVKSSDGWELTLNVTQEGE